MTDERGRSTDRAARRGPARRAILAVGRYAAPRKWRLVGAALVLLFYGAGWVAYVAGASELLSPLVVAPVLVILVAAGNLLQGWLGIAHRAPQFAHPPGTDDEPRDEATSAP